MTNRPGHDWIVNQDQQPSDDGWGGATMLSCRKCGRTIEFCGPMTDGIEIMASCIDETDAGQSAVRPGAGARLTPSVVERG